MTMTEFTQIIAGFIGTLGFTILFNLRGKRLVFTAVGGFLSWTLFVVFDNFEVGEALNYFIVAFLISVYAEIMAMALKCPTTTFITASLIPLIPGSSLYYTMANAFSSDRTGFMEKGLKTLELAAALALGIIIATAGTAIIKDFLRSKENNKRKNQ